MDIVQEDLWKVSPPCMLVVTTNAEVNKAGELVMGRGAALQAKTRDPQIALESAREVLRARQTDGKRFYGFLPIRSPYRPGKAGFGIFQVKFHWADNASLALIDRSCDVLKAWMADNRVPVRMNFPGIGNGRLNHDDVEAILRLSLGETENLTICYR